MIYKLITVDNLGEDLRKKVEENPAMMYVIQRSAASAYTIHILDRMAELVAQLCKASDPNERDRLLTIIDAYKKEYDEVEEAIDKLKKEEG